MPPAGTEVRSNDARDRADRRDRFDKLLVILRAQADILNVAQCPDAVGDTYARVIHYLSSLDDAQIQQILGSTPGRTAGDRTRVALSDDEVMAMSLDDIVAMLERGDASRKTLEQIAAVRFFVTRGELSGAPNRAALIEKLGALLENERTRLTIQKLASGPPDPSRTAVDAAQQAVAADRASRGG